jgi:beta-glucosidase
MKKYIVLFALLLFPLTVRMMKTMQQSRDYSKTYEISADLDKPKIPNNPFAAGKQFKQTWDACMAHKLNPKQKDFLFGLSSSAYQIEGGLDDHNSTADFYRLNGLTTAGIAIDFWNRYKTDIEQMKNELGINIFRLTIAWDRVEPEMSQFDQDAIQKYKDIIETLKSHAIEPIVALHHYTIPRWFNEIGGFEHKQNNLYFVRFAKKMYTNLQNSVMYWSTFNAPEAYAIKAYQEGENAPGKRSKLLTQQVLAHMLDAHVAVYHSIKGENGLYHNARRTNPTIPEPRIGIQKNLILFDISHKGIIHHYLSSVSGTVATIANALQNKLFFDFFRQGQAHYSLDWIGLNFYSNMNMFIHKPQEETEPEYMTENPRYRDYPEGIERAIKLIDDAIAQPLQIPIIITENGIATQNNPHGEEKRKRFFARTLENIRQLLDKKYNIIGYLPWSSHDSYEWPSAAFPQAFGVRNYGFFAVNFDKNSPYYLQRTLKPSSYYYRDFIKGYYGVVPQFTQEEYETQMPKPMIDY